MTTLTYPSGRGAPLGASPWQEWVAEVGLPALDSAQWAARTLAQAVLVALAWPIRLAWLVLRHVRWGSGETIVSAFALGLPAALLLRVAPSIVWPTAEQALMSLQHAVSVLVVAWLVFYLHAGTVPEFHSHGNASRRKVVRHEKAHQRALRRAGAGGSSRKIWRNPDGTWSGRVRASRRRFRKLSAAAQIGVYAAGRCAAPDTGSCSDDKQIDQIVNRQPARERDLVRRQGEALGARWGR